MSEDEENTERVGESPDGDNRDLAKHSKKNKEYDVGLILPGCGLGWKNEPDTVLPSVGFITSIPVAPTDDILDSINYESKTRHQFSAWEPNAGYRKGQNWRGGK